MYRFTVVESMEIIFVLKRHIDCRRFWKNYGTSVVHRIEFALISHINSIDTKPHTIYSTTMDVDIVLSLFTPAAPHSIFLEHQYNYILS